MTLERNSKLINRKFIQYLIPSILMMFAMQFASLLDGILIGNMIGIDALAAVSLVIPVLYIIQFPGFALGIGGSIVVANLFGQRNIEGAKKAFSISMIIGMGLSVIFAILAFFISSPLAMLFGEASYNYSYPYIFISLLTVPVITFVLLIGSFMAVDNSPRTSSILYIMASAMKVGLQILFIGAFGWDIYGAALSTAVGYFVACVICTFIYAFGKKRTLSFTLKVKNAGIMSIIKASSTMALNMILMAVQMFVINIFVGNILVNDTDLLIFGVIANMVFVFELFCGGIINVIPTICGILYGEKDYYSLKSIAKKIYIINMGVTVLLCLFIAIFPNVYAWLFGYNVTDGYEYMAMMVRIYLLSFIGYEINKLSMSYYPSIDRNIPSIITVILKQILIVLPVTLILLHTNGLLGYCLGITITETATAVITYIFIFFYNKKKNYHGIFMLEKIDSISYDLSIENKLENASNVSMELTKFALANGVNNREAQVVGLASEEMVYNIITYGYKKHRIQKTCYIDINLKLVDDQMLLCIRDDGLPFDPTKYEFDNDENYSTSGIQLISKLVDKLTYMRVLSLNNTVFEISLGGKTDGN